MKTRDVMAVFNRGRISRLALARTDVARVALSADVQTNWMPRTLGAMSLRPGLRYRGELNGPGASIPFRYSTTDTAIIDLSAGEMRVWNNGTTLLERPSVSTSIVNGFFGTNLANWADDDEAGAVSSWDSIGMKLVGNGTAYARRTQLVSVALADAGKTHALRIVVDRGPVILRVGTTFGGDDIFRQAVLRTGVHSIAFNPVGDFYVRFQSNLKYPVFLESCSVEAGGALSLPTVWASADDIRAVRWEQSADVMFLASGYQPRRIERRPNNSWSVVLYEANDGPFLTENVETTTLTPSGIDGEISVTASDSLFQDGHVGALFKIVSQGQSVSSDITSELSYTNSIRVTGVDKTRIFQLTRAGTWAGTVTLQRSIGAEGSWEDVEDYTGNGTKSINDGFDNSIVYYRLGFNAGDYTSGTAELSMDYGVGSIAGIVRFTAVNSETSADAIVLEELGGTKATEIWSEGAWSEKEGWPTAVGNWEGRMWWSGNGRNYGSVSDTFNSFDPEFEGDAGPINKTVGSGVVSTVNWMLPLSRMIVGTDGAENTVRSNSFEEPVTPTNYNSKADSTKGSAAVPAASVDGNGYFVDRTSRKVYEISYDAAKYKYSALDLTLLCPEIGDAGFVRVGVQQTPDMRLHCVRADGTVGVLVRDAAEDVLCWVDLKTDGFIEGLSVLPGPDRDRVFYRVRRIIGGATRYYHEELASEDDCVGGLQNHLADSFLVSVGPQSGEAITGLDHLEGKEVVVWGDGQDRGTETVVNGEIRQIYQQWVVGLPYTADYQSAKLAGQTALGLSLTQQSLIDHIGLVLTDTHAQGLKYGPDADNLDDLPLYEDGAEVDPDAIWGHYDQEMIEFPGDWDTDNRIYLQASAPRPCTVLAAVLSISREDKA